MPCVDCNQASDVLHHLLDPTSKKGAALRQTLPGGVVPDLTQLFAVGQFVRCCVTDLRSGGADDATDAQQDQQPQQTKKGQAGKGGKPRKKGKHVELTLRLRSVCGGVGPDAIKPGQVLPACIRSVEDHGYIITFGIKVMLWPWLLLVLAAVSGGDTPAVHHSMRHLISTS